jgi:hypothetical protein
MNLVSNTCDTRSENELQREKLMRLTAKCVKSGTLSLSHARLAGGGAPLSTNLAYIGATGSGSCLVPPPGEFITSSEIFASSRDGIDRGWSVGPSTDFLPSNSFTAVAERSQSTPNNSITACATVICP